MILTALIALLALPGIAAAGPFDYHYKYGELDTGDRYVPYDPYAYPEQLAFHVDASCGDISAQDAETFLAGAYDYNQDAGQPQAPTVVWWTVQGAKLTRNPIDAGKPWSKYPGGYAVRHALRNPWYCYSKTPNKITISLTVWSRDVKRGCSFTATVIRNGSDFSIEGGRGGINWYNGSQNAACATFGSAS